MSEQLYVWLVKVYIVEEKSKDGVHWKEEYLQFKKVFTSKISAINYKIKMENKGYKVTIEKYTGD